MESNWGLGAGGWGFEAMRESPAVTHGCTGDWWQAATTKTAAQRTRVTLVSMPHVNHQARRSRELRHAILGRCGDFEGQVAWVLGIAAPSEYRVAELTGPARLVVDVRHGH